MPKTFMTKSIIRFVKKNRLLMCANDMGRKFGFDGNIISRWLRNNGLSAPSELQLKWRYAANRDTTTSKPYIDKILKDWYLIINVNTLANSIERSETFVKTRLRQLGLVIPREIIEQRKLSARIKPGNIPLNKGKKQIEYMSKEAIARTAMTRFKKGNLPPNTKEKDGVIVIRHDHADRNNSKPYKYIRLSLGVWKPLHIYRWERKRGKVPVGHCLWFKDQNPMNCTLKNLELISRAENMRRNTIQNYPTEIKELIWVLTSLTRKIKKYGKRN